MLGRNRGTGHRCLGSATGWVSTHPGAAAHTAAAESARRRAVGGQPAATRVARAARWALARPADHCGRHPESDPHAAARPDRQPMAQDVRGEAPDPHRGGGGQRPAPEARGRPEGERQCRLQGQQYARGAGAVHARARTHAQRPHVARQQQRGAAAARRLHRGTELCEGGDPARRELGEGLLPQGAGSGEARALQRGEPRDGGGDPPDGRREGQKCPDDAEGVV